VQIAPQDNVKLSFFKDENLKPESKVVLDDLAILVAQVKDKNLPENLESGEGPQQDLYRWISCYIANQVWFRLVGFYPLVPISVIKTKKSGERKESIGKDFVTYRTLIAEAINKLRIDKDTRLGYAFLTQFDACFDSAYKSQDDKRYWNSYLKRSKKFLPTWSTLTEIGRVPDVKISRFKTLFSLSEWEVIHDQKNNGYVALEEKVNSLKREKITVDNCESILKTLTEITTELQNNVLFRHIQKIKAKKLLLTTRFKHKKKHSESYGE
jgi:hypothetical protein